MPVRIRTEPRTQMPHANRTCLLVPLVLLLGGCSYLKNRANDVFDVFRFDVGWGPGLYSEARATDFAAVGIGLRDQQLASLYGRFVGNPEVFSVALGPFVLGSRTSLDMEPLLAGDPTHFDIRQDIPGTQVLFLPAEAPRCSGYSLSKRGFHIADVGADLALGYVGVGVGVSPGEFVDLLLGFVGIDLAGDDVFGREPVAAAPSEAVGAENERR